MFTSCRQYIPLNPPGGETRLRGVDGASGVYGGCNGLGKSLKITSHGDVIRALCYGITQKKTLTLPVWAITSRWRGSGTSNASYLLMCVLKFKEDIEKRRIDQDQDHFLLWCCISQCGCGVGLYFHNRKHTQPVQSCVFCVWTIYYCFLILINSIWIGCCCLGISEMQISPRRKRNRSTW